ncbi:diguanylate cyclase domain-containing protein [Bacterioplanoides sp.]|uniref:sensor domain-containing diguanylate cyclase n=1 Tax=Bacterioplanoides sp. TaxID=2066072 RepID=UPI003B59235E
MLKLRSPSPSGWMYSPLLPWLAGILLTAMSFVLWFSVYQREQAFLEHTLQQHSERIVVAIRHDINKRIQAVQRLADRWQLRGGTPRPEFYADATNYVIDDIGYQAIDWVDESYHVRWVVPEKGNEAAINLDLAFEERRLRALERAKKKNAPTLSSPIQLVQGGTGVLIYFPLYVQKEFNGFVLAVLNTDSWLENLLHNHKLHDQNLQNPKSDQRNDDLLIQVLFEDDVVFRDKGFDTRLKSQAFSSAQFFMAHQVSAFIQPTPEFYRSHKSYAAEVALISGLLFTVILSLMVRLYQKVSRAKVLAASNLQILKAEMSQRQEAEKSLALHMERLNHILEGTNVGSWEWNVQTGETVFNQRWAEIIGYSLEELQPVSIDTWMSYAHPDDLEKSGELLEQHFNGELEFYDTEARMKHKDGHWVWVHDRGKVYSWTADGKPEWMAGTHQEITERKQAEEKIKHLANHDALTGLPTLRLAKDRIKMAINMAQREKKQVAVLFVDLDGFKAVNDTYGHEAGDSLLKAVGDNLRTCVRTMDTVARIGGDEFLVILTNINQRHEVEEISTKLIAAVGVLSGIFDCQEADIQLGASIGISMYSDDGDDIKQLIANADKAMYQVKAAGKNSFRFYSD